MAHVWGLLVHPLSDWTKTQSHSAGLGFDTANASYLGGDTARVRRTTSSAESVVYLATGTSLEATTWFWPSESVADFTFFTSANGSTWTAKAPTTAVLTNSNWKKKVYTLTGLTSGQYVKIQWAAGGTSWARQLGQVLMW